MEEENKPQEEVSENSENQEENEEPQ